MMIANLLASFKGSDARATVRAAIGDAEDDGRGFSVSLNFLHKGNGKKNMDRSLACRRRRPDRFLGVKSTGQSL